MFSFDNTHIFTGYLKQLLSSFNLPMCKVYTSEFDRYLKAHGREDPRIIESFDTIGKDRIATRVNYLKNSEVYHFFCDHSANKTEWRHSNNLFYEKDKRLLGFTRTLSSPGISYDTKTHEYLGDYLRFLRDYYNVNLMSLYNCFNNKFYTNVSVKVDNLTFDSRDAKYKIYAFPVKLFANYTIAIDSNLGIELFCGLYKTSIETSNRGKDLIRKTYQKINKTLFNQPFVYSKLDVEHWQKEDTTSLLDVNKISRCDIINREQDLKLFIKVPASCKSSITVLEGDFRHFNDARYVPRTYNKDGTLFNPKTDTDTELTTIWKYTNNHTVVNFKDKNDLNEHYFNPISKLQLLAFNTGESYPFAERLVEYLSGSAITPIEEIPDNIKRVQKVMNENNHYFKIEGIWENKIQKIAYDYMINSGPIKYDSSTNKLKDERHGIHPGAGYTTKSTVYDVLGYIDKDTEKCYSSWKIENEKAKVRNSIQNVDIYIDQTTGKSLWDI